MLECTPPAPIKPMRCKVDLFFLTCLIAFSKASLLSAAVGNSHIDPGQILIDNVAGADIEMTGFGVAILSLR